MQHLFIVPAQWDEDVHSPGLAPLGKFAGVVFGFSPKFLPHQTLSLGSAAHWLVATTLTLMAPPPEPLLERSAGGATG
jgi:hypothetical protein